MGRKSEVKKCRQKDLKMLRATKYVELLNFLIPEFAKKHQGTVDKGLFWEMIKMEIRAFTVKFSKRKAKSKREEECALLSEMIKLQCKLQTEYSDSLRSKLERIKTKLSKIASVKTRGTIIRGTIIRYLSSVGNRYPAIYVASYVGRKSEVKKCRQKDFKMLRAL